MEDVQRKLAIVVARNVHPHFHFRSIRITNDLRGQQSGFAEHDEPSRAKRHRQTLGWAGDGT